MSQIICKKCSVPQDPEDFGDLPAKRNGKQSWCKKCMYESHKDWRRQNHERHNKLIRISKLRKRGANITLKELEDMEIAQNCLCAICGQPETCLRTPDSSMSRLAVDHCHKTGKVRGLLCRLCNSSLGRLGVSPHLLQASLDYMIKHYEK